MLTKNAMILFTILVFAGCAKSSSPDPMKPQLSLENAAEKLASSPTWVGVGQRERIETRLEESIPTKKRRKLKFKLAKLYLREGRSQDSINLLDELQSERAENQIHYLRALAHLRLAEVENCIEAHCQQSCIYPIQAQGQHHESQNTTLALKFFNEYLKSGGPLKLESEWLRDLCKGLLSPPKPTESEARGFTDVAQALGVETMDLAGSVLCEDFDNDGHQDIIFTSMGPREHVKAFRGAADGSFWDSSGDWNLSEQLGGLFSNAADYDNDGDLDILVLRGAWLGKHGCVRNSLLENDGSGKFTDVTEQSGLAWPAAPTQTAVWGDFDADGFLDLFVGNERTQTGFSNQETEAYPCQLFINQKDGTFSDIATEAGVTNDRFTKGACAGDFDNDGDLDLYVSNMDTNGTPKNRLYQNNSDGTFTDIAQGALLGPSHSFAVWFFDFNNDGWEDIFCGSLAGGLSDFIQALDGSYDGPVRTTLLLNRDGQFTDVSREYGLGQPHLGMGASFGDIDNDGFLDIYMGTGLPDFSVLVPNLFWRNDGGQKFVNQTAESGLGHLQKGHGICFADFDLDGDLDIFAQMGGAFLSDVFSNSIFRNERPVGNSVALRLRGKLNNRFGVGARVCATLPSGRKIFRRVGIGSSFGYEPMTCHLGLGSARSITSLEVNWPNGQSVTYQSLDSNFIYELDEQGIAKQLGQLQRENFHDKSKH